ncbi:MAG: helix-turn-helix transcriptional regulator [Desulfosalsimonas sp.]
MTPSTLSPKRRTKKRLAQQAGISYQWLHQIIAGRGRASIDTAEKLARITGSNPLPWAKGDFAAIAAILDQYFSSDEQEGMHS